MKNLNIKNVRRLEFSVARFVNKKWVYSICAVVFLFTCSLNSNAQTDSTTAVDMGSFTPGVRDSYGLPIYNTDYACINNYGMDGNDYWTKITITDACYLSARHGSTSGSEIFDTVIHLLDSNGSLIAYNDDVNPPYDLRAQLEYYLYPGVYYVIIDGTSSKGHNANGGISMHYEVYY